MRLRRLEDLLRDVRHAFRSLRRAPGFALVAILTLGLGLGANAAIFGVLDAALLRPLPYPESDRIVTLHILAREGHNAEADFFPWSWPKFDLFRKTWRACNHPGPMPRVFLQRQVHVAETDAKAHEQAREYLSTREGGAVPVGGGPIEKTRIGWGAHARGMGRDSERPDDKARGETMRRARESYDYTIDSGLALVGSPDTVIRKLEEGKQRIGYDIFCTNHEIGKMPKEMVCNSIALFGKEVVPAFQN